MTAVTVCADDTNVFPRLLDLAYPNVERGDGVRLYLTDGREILDACSGGAMVACLGHGVREIVEAGAAQAEKLAYVYNHHFTNEPRNGSPSACSRSRRRRWRASGSSPAARRRTRRC